jgi:hypothetical protein
MRFLFFIGFSALVSTSICAPVAQELQSRTDSRFGRRQAPIVNGNLYQGCANNIVNIQDLTFITGMPGRSITAANNINLIAQEIIESIAATDDAPPPAAPAVELPYLHGLTGTEGQFLWTLGEGSSEVEFNANVLTPVITDSLNAMQTAGRNGIALSIRDSNGRVIYSLSIRVVQ